jgi:UDP-hydrolysing UDP-N-acetyl-D-glucosamine 2-epimerase
MAQPTQIAVITGSRAEFGLLKPVMCAIDAHPHLQLRTLVTGTHLTTDSHLDLDQAGLTIDAKASMQAVGATGRGADTAALGRGIEGIGQTLEQWQPDCVLVLGDRIEAFAGACAASVGGFALAHVHGGDRAEGVADEAMRHAITKLAHLHFPATAASRRRIQRMGEARDSIFPVGSPAIDGIKDIPAAEDPPAMIVMQHPIGAARDQERQWMAQTLAATRGHNPMVMMPNHDPGREGIVDAIEQAGVEAVTHLPRAQFIARLKGTGMLVGNSSAGLIEAAALKRPCVNVGPRQNGREKPPNVVDVIYGQDAVSNGIEQAQTLDLRRMRQPYGRGEAGARIAEHLAAIDFKQMTTRKLNAY